VTWILPLLPHKTKRAGTLLRAGASQLLVSPLLLTLTVLTAEYYLGTPGGGALLGREGTDGGGPGSGDTAEREGGLGAARPPGRGGPGGARRCGVGLDIGDLKRPAETQKLPTWFLKNSRSVTRLPASRWHPSHLQPGVIDGRRHCRGDGGGADVTDDAKTLSQGMVHPEHLITVLGLDQDRARSVNRSTQQTHLPTSSFTSHLWTHLFLGLLHQGVLVSTRVKLSQQVSVDELLRLKSRKEVI